MIILRQQDYSRKTESELDEEIKQSSFSFIKELFKYLLMYSNTSGDVTENHLKHWTQEAAGFLNRVDGDRAIKLFLGLVDNYKNLPKKRYNREFVKDLRGGYDDVKDFVNSMKKFIREEKDKGANKYSHALDHSTDLSEWELVQMCKFIALCLTGQLHQDYDNWYDRKVETTQMNWEKRLDHISYEHLRNILKSITGGI